MEIIPIVAELMMIIITEGTAITIEIIIMVEIAIMAEDIAILPVDFLIFSNMFFFIGILVIVFLLVPPLRNRNYMGRMTKAKLIRKMKVDPETEKKRLKEIEEDFVRIQAAWSKQDLTEARDLYALDLYNQHSKQLAEMKKRNERNVVTVVQVLGFYKYRQLDSKDHFIIGIEAKVIDYTEDLKTGNLISGSKTQKGTVRQEWEFIKQGKHLKLVEIHS